MFESHGTSYEATLRIYRPIVEPLFARGERDWGGNSFEDLFRLGGWERDAGWRDERKEVVGDSYELGRARFR